MLENWITYYITCAVIMVLAFVFDLAMGDPPSRLHLVVWMGYVIEKVKKLNRGSRSARRVLGVLAAIAIIALFSIPVYLVLKVLSNMSYIAYIIIAGLLLKFSFAFRSLADYTKPIAERLMAGDIDGARSFIPYIARRDPAKLNEELMVSTAVESIAESTVDGITSPLFYFALFGVPGAIAYRVANTLDSMLGYKTQELKDFGWFSAKLDTILNFVSSRLTALLIAFSAWLLKLNGKTSLKIALRDHSKTESLNAGWPMSAMAGALNVRLVKVGFYELGDPVNKLQPIHILQAIKIMRLTVLFYIIIICLPILALRCIFLTPWVI
ncbi:MAG: cobalamin biosynthesis protein [Candidatus Nezhaarchaeales archaeon]